MALYNSGKYSFDSVLSSLDNVEAKEFVEYKRKHYYDNKEKNYYIEQWLYNEDFDKIDNEFTGFVVGRHFPNIATIDIDIILGKEELFPHLAKIKKEMSDENNWNQDLSDWDYWLKKDEKTN